MKNKSTQNKLRLDICYLCGQPLDGEKSKDHVPPLLFFAGALRKKHNISSLWTLRTHVECNNAFGLDEEYFAQSMGPLAGDSYSGKALLADMASRTETSSGASALAIMVSKEFDPRPGGIFLPVGRVVKRSDGVRIHRVIWKVTRGLFFKEHGVFLPESTPNGSKILSVGEKPPDWASGILGLPEKGAYPGVFAYKTATVGDHDGTRRHYWAMLFWDRLITLVSFHDPACACQQCKNKKESGRTNP